MTNAAGQPAVVVGVKGSGHSRAAIMLAAEEARYRGAALIAITAYSSDSAVGAPAGRPLATLHTTDKRVAAESALRDAVVDALGDEADRVELRAMPGLAGRNLIDTAREVDAQLIVLAGRGGWSVLPGTVSQYVLHRAPCPVLIVPEASAAAQPSTE